MGAQCSPDQGGQPPRGHLLGTTTGATSRAGDTQTGPQPGGTGVQRSLCRGTQRPGPGHACSQPGAAPGGRDSRGRGGPARSAAPRTAVPRAGVFTRPGTTRGCLGPGPQPRLPGVAVFTEVQELLHGERRGRELAEVLDVGGDAGQRRPLAQAPQQPHGDPGPAPPDPQTPTPAPPAPPPPPSPGPAPPRRAARKQPARRQSAAALPPAPPRARPSR